MKLKKITIYLVVMFFLFQESINRWVNIGIIGNLDEILIAILLLYFLLNIVKNKKIKKNIYLIVCFTILFSLFGILSCYLNSEFILSRVIISNFLAIKFFVMIFSLSIFNFKTSVKFQ